MVRLVTYLSHVVEQDHRAVKRATRPMPDFKSFRGAGRSLSCVELMDMIRKGRCAMYGVDAISFADQFHALAGKVRPV